MRNQKPHLRQLLVCLLLAVSTAGARSQAYSPTPEQLQAREEFRDMKFGIFIHWGLYAMLGDGEWVMNNKNINYQEYTHLADGFCPSLFDADEWVSLFKEAGARYITFTSRHHDGFSMFRTAEDSYNVADGTPFRRDVVKELAGACQRQDLRLHLYYSHLDWHRPDYPLGRTGKSLGRPTDKQDWSSYYAFMNRQLTELLTNYGKIGAVWFDGFWDHDSDPTPFDWQAEQQYALIHRLQPACLVGNNHHEKMLDGEDIQIFEQDLPGENTAGFSAGQTVSEYPLESCQTMNQTWGYNITDKSYKSADELIARLVRAAGKNANLLLNVGPRPDGKLPVEAVAILKQMGQWLRQNGETIYGTRGGRVAPHDWGVTTEKKGTLYVHIMKLADKALFLPVSGKAVKAARVYATGEKVRVNRHASGVTIELPEVPTGLDYIVELTLND